MAGGILLPIRARGKVTNVHIYVGATLWSPLTRHPMYPAGSAISTVVQPSSFLDPVGNTEKGRSSNPITITTAAAGCIVRSIGTLGSGAWIRG